ncbi:MAG: type II toxin-antitoxin system RelE/ParE family toxin [Pyrinomonadaceae bacterium]|nr:type II toxin-antitoxin system RelE/ParE family toxin [Pyrinomonadaceae bacterium]
MYKITITRSAEKSLKNLDRQAKNRIVSQILSLADEPRPHGCRKVISEEGLWRVRIGDWRLGYAINDDDQTVTVIRVDHRSSFYD